jgi:putative ABC transport system ATP-binding protein
MQRTTTPARFGDPSQPALVVKDLYKFHGAPGEEIGVLRGVDFELARGEFLCIMGPSGSGKSTLLHLVAGLERPTAGSVTVFGEPMSELDNARRTLLRRRAIGYVFQFFNLLPNLTVEENVGLPLAIRGERPEHNREAIGALLARFGLGGRGNALPHQLSGGQMQRTSIARALIGDQPLLLADEPTGNLSQAHGVEILETLRRVCDEDGRTVLLVTHNPRDAAYADRVAFLVDGKLDPSHQLTGKGIRAEDVHAALVALGI